MSFRNHTLWMSKPIFFQHCWHLFSKATWLIFETTWHVTDSLFIYSKQHECGVETAFAAFVMWIQYLLVNRFDRTAKIDPTEVSTCRGSFGGFESTCFQLDRAARIETTGISYFSCDRSSAGPPITSRSLLAARRPMLVLAIAAWHLVSHLALISAPPTVQTK